MLFSLDDTLTAITAIPKSRLSNFLTWKARLSAAEYDDIVVFLNGKINLDEVHNSSWLASQEWENTPLQLLYTKACLLDEEAAAKFLGLIVWETMINRPESWSFARIERDGMPDGMTYFKI